MTLLLRCLLAVLCCAAASCQSESQKASAPPPSPIPPAQRPSAAPRGVWIAAVGDLMLGNAHPDSTALPSRPEALLDAAAPLLQSADLSFGNLEGVLCDLPLSPKGCKSDTCYRFRMPQAYAQVLASAGFDLLSMANNHSGDFGSRGRKQSIRALQQASIQYAGLLEHPSARFEQEGVRYGFIAFAPNAGTLPLNQIEHAQELVRMLADSADIVVVSFHGGAEGESHRHLPRRAEHYRGENRGNVHRFAHAMVDAGADLLLGHGPHVPRCLELYRGRLIAYSLGNFCTFRQFSLAGSAKLAPLLRTRLDKDGTFLEGQLHSFVQRGSGGVQADSTQAAYRSMQRLTDEDLPEHGLHFLPDGRLLPAPVL